jgi:hypothetical protein
MSITRTQFNHAENSAFDATPLAVALAGIAPHSLVVVRISYDNSLGQTTASLVDDLAVAGALAVGVTRSDATQRIELYYFKDHGGGSRTFTWTGSAASSSKGIVATEYADAHLTSPLDGIAATDSGPGVSTAPTSGNISPAPSVNGTLIYGSANSGGTPTWAAPFSSVFHDTTNVTDDEDYVQPTAGGLAATWTSASDTFGALAASFKPAPPTVPVPTSRASLPPQMRRG